MLLGSSFFYITKSKDRYAAMQRTLCFYSLSRFLFLCSFLLLKQPSNNYQTMSNHSKLLLLATFVALLPACRHNQVSLEDDRSGFVLLTDAVPDAILEIRYYSTYNFVGTRIDGYLQPVALLTREAADSLHAVSNDLKADGYRLKIYDAYRPQCAVDHFVRWAADVNDTLMRPSFYPDVDKSRLFAEDYIMEKSGHTRGSTVDLTIINALTGKEVDMGGTFDWFGIESHPDYCGNPETGEYTGAENNKQGITEEQFRNRMILRQAMLRHGFRPIDSEWWHFTLANEPYPDTYFTFLVKE